jgi:nitrate reductase assembly molybdenum cofactor insertion protein NarJ
VPATRAATPPPAARELDAERYGILADAFDYPGADYRDRIARLRAALARALPDSAPERGAVLEQVDALHHFVTESEPGRVEEAFTSTFDMKPVCTLGCGYQVFGESYKRGRLLAGLQETVERCGIDSLPDRLPDELPVLLRLLPRLYADGPSGAEEAFDLLSVCLLPAVGKMEKAFTDGENLLGALVAAVAALLRFEHPDALEAMPESNLEVLLP